MLAGEERALGAPAKLTREYGKRLGVLTADQLQAACDRFGLGRALAADAVPQGLFGQNVFLSTSKGEFVLRGCPHFDWQLPKERLVARMLHERTTLKAPWPYHVELDPSVFGWPYAVMRRVPGVVEGADGEDEHLQVARALGHALAALHAIEADAPAYYDLSRDAFVPFPMSHEERVVGLVTERRDAVRDLRSAAMQPEDERWIDEIVEAARPELRGSFTTRYVHHDFKPNNVLCEKTPKGWVARGVVDLMEGYFGDPEEDLVRSIGTLARFDRSLPNAFVAAYGALRPLRAGHRARYRLYQLHDCLVFWDYGQRNRIWFQSEQHFRDFARGFVGLDPFRPPAALDQPP